MIRPYFRYDKKKDFGEPEKTNCKNFETESISGSQSWRVIPKS